MQIFNIHKQAEFTKNNGRVGFHVRILVMRIIVEVVPAPRDIPVQSVHIDNSCPG